MTEADLQAVIGLIHTLNDEAKKPGAPVLFDVDVVDSNGDRIAVIRYNSDVGEYTLDAVHP